MVAVAALIAFAVPAMAAGSVHVRALLDVGYTMNSQERTASGDSVTAVFMNIPGHSYLRGLWMSDDKKAGAHAELGLNSHAFNGTGSTLRYIYGWYKIGACKLVAGHTDSTFGSLAYSPSSMSALARPSCSCSAGVMPTAVVTRRSASSGAAAPSASALPLAPR